jgi:hypothetical protein
MKKNIYQKWIREGNKRKSIEDLRDSLPEYFGQGWKVLETPIVLDVDLIDILLLKDDGRLIIVKVVDKTDDLAFVGKMILEYSILNEKRDKLRASYSDEYIDVNKDLYVVLFVPAKNAHLEKALSHLSFVVNVYTYMFIQSGTEQGIVLDKMSVQPKNMAKSHEYDSMLRIMGENVRSEHSQYSSADVPMASPISSNATPPIEKDLQTPVPQQDISIAATKDFVEKTSLSEEELIAFFDLEKKVDSYCNISRNNSEK